MKRLLLHLLLVAIAARGVVAFTPIPPKVSPATGLTNELYTWKAAQQIRYQVSGPEDGEPVVLVHGLFVNSDHWRKTLQCLGDHGYRAYALDLWGCGYSSKPPRDSPVAQAVNGEQSRFLLQDDDNNNNNALLPRVLKKAVLGTADGKGKRVVDVELTHPLQSPYNFYTWADLVTDFCTDVVRPASRVTLVSNSIGTISALQAVLDTPSLFRGVFVVAPNFRELHSAEVPLPRVTMPLVRIVQSLLRTRGQGLFDALATPSTVQQILKEPYAVESAVDDVLVRVLLDPLLTEGASQVVFDTLSYSAGPLPEIQLAAMPSDKPVWVCYGQDDPWTPGPRVQALQQITDVVERVESFPGVGHCPHDEAPEQVHPLLLEYLQRVCQEANEDETCQVPLSMTTTATTSSSSRLPQ